MTSFLHGAVADRVRTILAAQTTVTVFGADVEPGSEAPRETFLVDFEDSSFSFPTMRSGTRSFDALITLRVQIETHRPGLSSVATQARWFELADIVMDALRANPSLQTGYPPIAGLIGMTGEGQVRGPGTAALPDGTGWACGGDLLVTFRSRFC